MENIKNKGVLREYGQDLMNFCQKKIGFSKIPDLTYVHDQDNYHNLLGKTAYYNPDEMTVVVYITGRHPKDILRSIAHELVHHKQNEDGQLYTPMSEDYFSTDSHLHEMELAAYKEGNKMFREWTQTKQKKKGGSVMIEGRLKNAIKSLIKQRLETIRETTAMAAGAVEGVVAQDEELELEENNEVDEELELEENNEEDEELELEENDEVEEDLDHIEESKIVTPEQEESFHNRLFGPRLVALNARLMGTWIKK